MLTLSVRNAQLLDAMELMEEGYLEECQACGKLQNDCQCVCPGCGEPCFDDGCYADHGRCWGCQHS